jgi:hypothetical protein
MLPPLLPLVLAAPVATGEEAERPCRADVKRLCPGAAGGPAVRACLREHEDALSEACRTRMEAGRERGKAMKDACAADVKAHCAGVERGQGRLHRCLREHQADLSPGCRDALPRRDDET